MIGMHPTLQPYIDEPVKQELYETTVLLHNIDRAPCFTESIKVRGLASVLEELLGSSPFEFSDQRLVVDAIVNHSKFKDDPNDSALMQMLRLADKWDRLSVIGMTSGIAWLGCQRQLYDPESPFGFGSTAEGKGGWQTLYQNFFRILEWYAVFPKIRLLVDEYPERFMAAIAFVRAFGAEIAATHNIPNKVEDDLNKVFGEYYVRFKP